MQRLGVHLVPILFAAGVVVIGFVAKQHVGEGAVLVVEQPAAAPVPRDTPVSALPRWLTLVAPATAEEATTEAPPPNLRQAAIATGVLAKMGNATKLAGLDNPDIKVGPLTLLAPSDAAFDALPADFREKLLAPENRQHLTDLLIYHALPGLFPTDRLLKAKARNYTVDAIDGSTIEINKRLRDGVGSIDFAGARIVTPDIMASDGIIHVIDKVLIPPHVAEALSGAAPGDAVAEADPDAATGEGDQ